MILFIAIVIEMRQNLKVFFTYIAQKAKTIDLKVFIDILFSFIKLIVPIIYWMNWLFLDLKFCSSLYAVTINFHLRQLARFFSSM